ncbi:MAG: sigma-70 family RNA polymerase sigma factor [Chloroflexi bacterium]|nr:sigma-70 family RNA polymerase sigma factor [Chloroflexota bacterium]
MRELAILPEVAGALFVFLLMAAVTEDGKNVLETDIQDYVVRAQRGDREALAILYQLHVRAIHRYIAARVSVKEDCEDITAEVFVDMVKALPAYRPTGAPFAAWLYRIASARVADYYRKNGNTVHDGQIDHLQDPGSNPEEALQNDEAIAQVRRALNQLSEEQRVVLIMRFVDRKSHADVASALGKSTAAVKTLQHRALVALSELLGSPQKARHYLRGTRE